MTEIVKTEMVKIEDIKRLQCGWLGCQETCACKPEPLPAGWVFLLVARDTGDVKMVGKKNPKMWIEFPTVQIHDKVLCLHHGMLINEYLEVGPYSRKVE